MTTTYEKRVREAQDEVNAAVKALLAVCEEFVERWEAGADRETMTVLRGRMGAAKRRVKQAEQEMMTIISEQCTPEELEVLDALANEATADVLAAAGMEAQP